MTSGLDSEYIARRIGEVEYWHQRIPITEDIMTPGTQDTQTMLAYVGLPEDCSGMRVLDIGTRERFLRVEVERRGASEVIGLDNVPSQSDRFQTWRRSFSIQGRLRGRQCVQLVGGQEVRTV